ncbi:prevent-host-death protein [bacterium]|nr:prevent-host-death protein [bacterium]
MSKSALKPKLLEYFRHIEESGEPLIVTSHNKPVLKIEALGRKKRLDEVFGSFWGKVRIPADIMTPETEEWEEA